MCVCVCVCVWVGGVCLLSLCSTGFLQPFFRTNMIFFIPTEPVKSGFHSTITTAVVTVQLHVHAYNTSKPEILPNTAASLNLCTLKFTK